jgi:hypothetical protein
VTAVGKGGGAMFSGMPAHPASVRMDSSAACLTAGLDIR